MKVAKRGDEPGSLRLWGIAVCPRAVLADFLARPTDARTGLGHDRYRAYAPGPIPAGFNAVAARIRTNPVDRGHHARAPAPTRAGLRTSATRIRARARRRGHLARLPEACGADLRSHAAGIATRALVTLVRTRRLFRQKRGAPPAAANQREADQRADCSTHKRRLPGGSPSQKRQDHHAGEDTAIRQRPNNLRPRTGERYLPAAAFTFGWSRQAGISAT
jgi:hypothetical protein